ncbi:hypothetical protein PO909_011255 [Leuciscus waleckii]
MRTANEAYAAKTTVFVGMREYTGHGSEITSSSATLRNSSPFPALPVSSASQVTSCGSQDWLATRGRHCVMTGGPEGGWLSRHKPLIMCCNAGPRGFHFYRRNRKSGVIYIYTEPVNTHTHTHTYGTFHK